MLDMLLGSLLITPLIAFYSLEAKAELKGYQF